MARLIKFLSFCVFMLCANVSLADGLFGIPDIKIETPDFVSANDIRRGATDDTKCATKIFADALRENAGAVSETSHETDIQRWIYANFYNPDVLKRVLKCPEIANAADDETIKFIPIEYTFPGGRRIVVNYETQPKVLKQRLMTSSKRSLPNDSPDIMNDTGNVWTNTEPAWYAIMVVQSGALANFVGADKNNTISLEYIKNNIDTLFPRGACTSKTAIARDSKVMNVAAKRTVGVDDDTNDYYVFGDKNLQWISYAEIALDVVITVASFGGGALLSGGAKMIRASRTSKRLINTWKELRGGVKGFKEYSTLIKESERIASRLKTLDKTKDAAEIQRLTTESARIADQIKDMEKAEKGLKKAHNVEKYRDAVAQESKLGRDIENATKSQKELEQLLKSQRELEKLNQQMKTATGTKWNEYAKRATELQDEIRKTVGNGRTIPSISNTEGRIKTIGENIKRMEKETDNITKEIKQMEKYDDAVKEYRDVSKSIGELQQYTKGFRKLRVAQTGNVGARAFRAFRAAGKSQKVLNKSARVARASMKSGRIKEWLFQSTLKNAAKLATLEKNAGLIYALLKFGGDMYDWTSATTDEFTSGVEFAPLLLLGADDISGEENVVNYGTWLKWWGDSSSPADDDAAYLQAMDFATKLHQDLIEVMDEQNNDACVVDIYVVRPIIRNPDSDDASLYYLIMNDEPWSTRD